MIVILRCWILCLPAITMACSQVAAPLPSTASGKLTEGLQALADRREYPESSADSADNVEGAPADAQSESGWSDGEIAQALQALEAGLSGEVASQTPTLGAAGTCADTSERQAAIAASSVPCALKLRFSECSSGAGLARLRILALASYDFFRSRWLSALRDAAARAMKDDNANNKLKAATDRAARARVILATVNAALSVLEGQKAAAMGSAVASGLTRIAERALDCKALAADGSSDLNTLSAGRLQVMRDGVDQAMRGLMTQALDVATKNVTARVRELGGSGGVGGYGKGASGLAVGARLGLGAMELRAMSDLAQAGADSDRPFNVFALAVLATLADRPLVGADDLFDPKAVCRDAIVKVRSESIALHGVLRPVPLLVGTEPAAQCPQPQWSQAGPGEAAVAAASKARDSAIRDARETCRGILGDAVGLGSMSADERGKVAPLVDAVTQELVAAVSRDTLSYLGVTMSGEGACRCSCGE